MPDFRNAFTFEVAGVLAAAATTAKDRWVAPFNGTLINASAVVGTSPTGAALVLDVRKNGVSVFTTTANRPTIAINGTSAVSGRPDIASFVAGDVLDVTVVTVGSTVAGADLDVSVQYVVA